MCFTIWTPYNSAKRCKTASHSLTSVHANYSISTWCRVIPAARRLRRCAINLVRDVRRHCWQRRSEYPSSHAAPLKYAADLSYLERVRPIDNTCSIAFFCRSRRSPKSTVHSRRIEISDHFPWRENIWYVHHAPPSAHAAFYSSSPLTLNMTRARWPHGLLSVRPALRGGRVRGSHRVGRVGGAGKIFTPGIDILTAQTTDDVIAAMALPKLNSKESLVPVVNECSIRTLPRIARENSRTFKESQDMPAMESVFKSKWLLRLNICGELCRRGYWQPYSAARVFKRTVARRQSHRERKPTPARRQRVFG